MKNQRALLGVVALLCASCGQESGTAPTNEPQATMDHADIYASAVAATDRLEADYARDAGRKPELVLAFFGIAPGMDVLDMFSGGGYYTELLSKVVGEDGSVVAHANQAYLNFVGEEFAARHVEGRLDNVAVLMAENNELTLPTEKFDAILLILSFHDMYFVNEERSWPAIDGPKLLAELSKSLKPGGIIGIVDHNAAAGSPSTTGTETHRLDRAIVLSDMQAAGFVLEAESDLLRNPEDDYEMGVFAPETRGRTDRYVLRFRKAD
jgi:predicted methyltransferase